MGTTPRVTKSWRLCGWCKKPVYSHADSYEEREGVEKRLWHRKRCWPREKKRRAQLLKQLAQQVEPTGNAALDDLLETAHVIVPKSIRDAIVERDFTFPHIIERDTPEPPPDVLIPPVLEPEPEPEPESEPEPEMPSMAALMSPPPKVSRTRYKGQRGLQAKVFKILRAQTGVFSIDSILAELRATGEDTTHGTIGYYITLYRAHHKAAKFKLDGTTTVFLFNKDLLRLIAANVPGNAKGIPIPEPAVREVVREVNVPGINGADRKRIVDTLDALETLVKETRAEILLLLPPGVGKRPVD